MQACHKLKAALDDFCAQSGQLINFHKSSLMFSKNTCTFAKQVVGGVFNIPHSLSFGKHLGCSLFQGRPSAELFQSLTTKAASKLDTWVSNCFSKAGRVYLFKLTWSPCRPIQCNVINCLAGSQPNWIALTAISFGRPLLRLKAFR